MPKLLQGLPRDNEKPLLYTRFMEFLPFTLAPLFFALTLSLAMVSVIAYDARHYIIPNTLNISVIALYALAAFFLQLDVLNALVAAGVVLLVGLGIFALGFMGGGDVKLLVALSLWAGWGEGLLQLIVLTALFGGALAIIIILLRITLGRAWHHLFKKIPTPRLLTRGEAIPYGLAIAAAALWMIWTGALPGLAV